ncbi:MAG: hypothetical protein JW940_39720 [Polyangiaceae bacterium]|nr:hypothetical protein [Polyangiaceae bacterium]
MTEEEKARRAARTRTRIALYALGGITAFEFWDADSSDRDDPEPDLESNELSLLGGFGVGIRKNFTRGLGAHLRVLAHFDSPDLLPGDDEGWEASLFGMALALEGGLRLGPVADSAPWYFDILLGLGGRFIFGDGTCVGPQRCYLYYEHDSVQVEPDSTYDLGSSFFGITGGAATGFVFGDQEQYDLGIRFAMLSDTGGRGHMAVGLLFGWALD